MADSPGEAAAGQSQVHEWSSYPLSLPSQPPDIKNWFSSYEYESPGSPELVADPAGHNGSETQDPLEHSLLQLPRNEVALGENRFGGQSENEVFDRRHLVSVDESMVKRPPKRKQSLRALFGFLDKHEEATESDCQVALPVQRNVLEPLPICSATGFLDAKRSQEGANEHSKVPMDCYGISSADTQVRSPADQELEHSKFPANRVGSSLYGIQHCFPGDCIDSIEHGKVPSDCDGISSAETQVSSPADQELEYSELPVAGVGSLADIQKCFPEDGIDSIKYGKVPVDCDGISSVDTQVSSPADQEVEYSKLPVNCVGSGLADAQKLFLEDGIDSMEMPINFSGTNLANSEEGFRDGAEHSRLPVSHESVILAGTGENSPAEESDWCKPALDNKVQEETVASDGFIVVKRKHKLPEECKTSKIPKHPMGRDKATLQENHNVLEQKAQVQTRSPLADRTNIPEAATALRIEFCGKWKCPSKGKPHVGPPMKQLRLERWLLPEN